MEYVYLDWNVIQYMKHSTVRDSINGPEFNNLINRLSKKYKFPFSEGHLKDLAISFNPDNQQNIKSDLEYLNNLSQGYALGIIGPTEKILPTNNVNIYNFFKKIVSETQEEPDIKLSGGSYSVDMNILPKDDIFRPFLERSGGILDSDVMTEFLQHMWLSMDDPEHYKKFRIQVADIKKSLNNRDTILNKKSEYAKKLIPFLDFITSEQPENYLHNFDDVIKSFCHINGRSFDDMTIGGKIELSYMLLDFHPKFKDKINKKNRPSNIMRDCKNLYFASQAKYYVTEDSSTTKKAKFVCNALSLKVKITTMSEFMSKFC